MRTLVILGGALFIINAVLVVATAPDTEPAGYDRWQVVSDVSQQEMAQGHQAMMGQMQVAYQPQMEIVMDGDPMRIHLDADMIRLMEQNQAQIDRMLGRR